MGDLFPHEFKAKSEHRSGTGTMIAGSLVPAQSWALMCALTQSEYEALELEAPAECRHMQNSMRGN